MARRTFRSSLAAIFLTLLLPAGPVLAADLDGDGSDDLVFREHDSAQKRLRVLLGEQTLHIELTPAAQSWQGVDVRTGDFYRSPRQSVLARNLVTGETRLWRYEDSGRFSSQILEGLPGATSRLIEAVADFDGDGRDDLLLREQGSGARTVYRLRGAAVDPTLSGSIGIDNASGRQLVAAADFDGDGRADLLLRDVNTLRWVLLLLDGSAVRSTLQPALPLDPVWVLQGSADMDRDGRQDLLFRRVDTGEWRLSFMNGAQARPISGSVALPVDPAWRLTLLEDLDGDRNGDVLLRHAGTGSLYAGYLIQRGVRADSGPVALEAAPSRVVAGAGDFDGDGAAEVLLTSAEDAWDMAGLSSAVSPWTRSIGTAGSALTLACPPPAYADFRLPPPADPVGADSALLTWSRPATRSNGEGLCAHDLAGFRISAWRQGAPAYREIEVADGENRQRLVAGLPPGTWRFGVRAHDRESRIGPFSEIRSKTIRRPPTGP